MAASIVKMTTGRPAIFLRLLIVSGIVATLLGCATTGNRGDSSAQVVQQLMTHYHDWQGAPYRWGGNSKRGVDCSAFVQLTYSKVFRLGLPRNTEDQVSTGRRVRRNHLKSGDLVFFKTGWFKYHVGVYVGSGTFIHASESKGVTKSSMSSGYWAKRFWKARRVV